MSKTKNELFDELTQGILQFTPEERNHIIEYFLLRNCAKINCNYKIGEII